MFPLAWVHGRPKSIRRSKPVLHGVIRPDAAQGRAERYSLFCHHRYRSAALPAPSPAPLVICRTELPLASRRGSMVPLLPAPPTGLPARPDQTRVQVNAQLYTCYSDRLRPCCWRDGHVVQSVAALGDVQRHQMVQIDRHSSPARMTG